VLSHVRKKIKKHKKEKKDFDSLYSKKIINNLNFNLTNDQNKVLNEINNDIKSNYKMFRILQGDVGSGKTIVSFIAAANVIRSKCQVALMAPTEILSNQHYNLAKKIFKSLNINIKLLSGKLNSSEKKKNK